MRESGELYSYVTEGLQSFAEAGDDLRNQSLDGVMEQIRAKLEELASQAAQPFLQPLTEAAKALLAALSDPSLIASIRSVASEIAKLGRETSGAAGKVLNLLSAIDNFLYSGIKKGLRSLGDPSSEFYHPDWTPAERLAFGQAQSYASGWNDSTGSDAWGKERDRLDIENELDQVTVRGKPFGGGGGGGGGRKGGAGPNPLTDITHEETIAQKEYNDELKNTQLLEKEYDITTLGNYSRVTS